MSQPGNVHYRIQLKIKRQDHIIAERFADIVGYEHERIFDETYLLKENNKIRGTNSSRVFFGCRIMWRDLEKLGIFDFKNSGKVPRITKKLINEAKIKNPFGDLMSTDEGRLSLIFLNGFYNGDGNYSGGMSARILNSKKEFFEEIREFFNIPSTVRQNSKGLRDKDTDQIIWKPRYQLYLSPDIFNQILLSYNLSLQRKRPDGYKNYL